MGLFDRQPGGFADQAQKWMTPERQNAISAIGVGLSQMSAGQAVNLAPQTAALHQRQARANQKRQLDQSGIMDKFTPEQRGILATMEPSAAQKIIASVLFEKPKGPVNGVNVGGRLVDPSTGRVIYSPPSEAKPRATLKGADGFTYYQDDGSRVLPEIELPVDEMAGVQLEQAKLNLEQDKQPPIAGAPTTKQIKREDGSEVVVEWRPNPQDTINGGDWVPIDAPSGGGEVKVQGGDLTEKESQMTLFSSMQNETAPILNQIEEKYNPANLPDAVARATPLAGNYFQTEEGQIYRASSAVWAEGALRLATGAAATQPEIERVQSTYFAVPGDTPATVRFKSQLRDMYNRSIQAALGRGVPEGELMLPDEFAERINEQNTSASPEDPLGIRSKELRFD